MNEAKETTATIYRELVSTDEEVRAEFLSHFETDAQEFAKEMGKATMEWRTLDNNAQTTDRALIAAVVHAAITMNILSFKLFISGHIVASGNVFRQCIEAIALALLCSDKDLPMLTSFSQGKYSTKNAVRDVVRNWRRLGLISGTHDQLESAEEFYSRYSHITLLTIASMIPLSGEGTEIYVGASFDQAKLDAYRKEINGRVNLSKVFVNFILAVKANINKWPSESVNKSV